MNLSPEQFDVFLSCPMASVRSRTQYEEIRRNALTIQQCLQDDCGLSVYFAGSGVESRENFDEPDFSFVRDRDALVHSRYFLLYYPSRIVSSVLVEAGMAIALEKKAVYFVHDRKHLPFMLQHLDRVSATKIYETKSLDRIVKLLSDHKSNLFEPWIEPPATTHNPNLLTTRSDLGAAGNVLAAGRTLGPYTLVKRLGNGAFGTVWLAERRSSLATTLFALKFPHSTSLDLPAVRKEVQIWSRVSGHPNILPVIEADFFDQHLVIVSEYAPDGSLADWISRNWRRETAVAFTLAMARGMLQGLAHLHNHSMVHRDLKPGNVLLQGSLPKIADFGLARLLESTEQSVSVGGTPAYMAPEAWEGQRSEQSDLWSLGVILFELASGQKPFQEKELYQLTHSIQTRMPPPLPEAVPAELQALILRALEKNPDRRHPSATAMLAELTRIETSLR